jgi:hypothetical protein
MRTIQPEVEKHPFTLVLAEDEAIIEGLLSKKEPQERYRLNYSWFDHFSKEVPKMGTSFSRFELKKSTTNIEHNSFGGAVNELIEDIVSIPQPVLVARGPFMSWIAQFYLQKDLPLSGLVMIDPLTFDQDDVCTNYQDRLELYFPEERSMPDEFELLDEYLWTHDEEAFAMKIKQGVCPMLVATTQTDELWRDHANITAQRYTSCTADKVPVVDLDALDVDNCVRKICDWVDSNGATVSMPEFEPELQYATEEEKGDEDHVTQDLKYDPENGVDWETIKDYEEFRKHWKD